MINQTKLKKRIKSLLLSQKDIAEKAVIENTKFHRWLSGDKKLPENDVERIKNALK